jgi:tetratricopeptide (TPR) repeat protein
MAQIPGASRMPPPPPEVAEAIAGAAARLRAEANEATEPTRKSRLLYEVGEIEERGADEASAARDYLAAYNADTEFREPLEGLVRLLERRRSTTNLGKLLEALVRAAETPEERVRALVLHGVFCADVQSDLGGARGAAKEATEVQAGAHETAAAWLLLEHTAGKLGDVALREEALTGRVSLSAETHFRDLLRVDLADLKLASGDVEAAQSAYEALLDEESSQSFRAMTALERIFSRDVDAVETDRSHAAKVKLAALLERRGTLALSAADDPAKADALGLPRWMRGVSEITLALVRAADLHVALGDHTRASSLMDRVLGRLIADAKSDPEAPSSRSVLARVVMLRRLRLAELASETELAAKLATTLLEGEQDPRERAALSMRVAEHAASSGDRATALVALTEATRSDPQSLPARGMELDLLAEGDAPGFSAALSKFLAGADDEAKVRAALLSAFLVATEPAPPSTSEADASTTPAARMEAARAHLREAERLGFAKETAARFARTLAALADDPVAYDDATVELAGAVKDDEAALLCFELARARAERGDKEGEKAALDMLDTLPSGAFIARAVEAFGTSGSSSSAGEDGAPGNGSALAVEKLAELTESEDAKRGLSLIAALRADAGGDRPRARELLKKAGDGTLVSVLRAELAQEAQDLADAAATLGAAAERTEDPELGAALDLEAGLLLFKKGARAEATALFARADERAGGNPSKLSAYAQLAVSPDAIDTRRQALDAAEVAGVDRAVIGLDRFATEAFGGDPERARDALLALEGSDKPEFALAAALGRLLTAHGGADADVDTAIARIGASGAQGALFAAIERLKLARADGSTAHGEAASALLDAGGGAPAAVEWLAAALGGTDVTVELAARDALARTLSDDAAEAMTCSAAVLRHAALGTHPDDLLPGTSFATRITNLELSPPGAEPTRRAAALGSLEGSLGDAAETAAVALAAWNKLAAGESGDALVTFQNVTTACPEDLASWEGLRIAAERTGNRELFAMACEQLGARCMNDARGAAFWERAAITWLGLGGFDDRGEHALSAAITRDPARQSSFDKLFRRVRERKDGDALLGLIQIRLAHTEDSAEIAKLYWEQARVLREKQDPDGALVALTHVTMLEPDHIGALALTGEIFIRRGQYGEAAEHLARLSKVSAAPPKNRVTAGITAVDLYENKLNRFDLALDVLLHLNRAKLTTLPVRERIARAAARTGTWQEALPILEGLMRERESREGRIEAARLAMAIYRDKIRAPEKAIAVVEKLLSEAPSDGEALDLLLGLAKDSPERKRLLVQGRDAILRDLAEKPAQADPVRRLARIAQTLGDPALEQATLSASVALSGPEQIVLTALAQSSGKKPRVPQTSLPPQMFGSLLAPDDDGPIADLFILLAPTLAEALGPQIATLGVTKKDRVDARSGTAVRDEIAAWAGALGLGAFDLFVGGRDPFGVQGIAGDPPSIVIGTQVTSPLSPQMRGRIAREVVGIQRGSTVTRWRDDLTIAAIVVAACNLAKVPVSAPAYAVLAEVERLIGKAIPRKVKGLIEPVCQKIVQTGQDPKAWAMRARASQSRAAVVASGDVSVVLADLLGEPLDRLSQVTRDDLRAEELFRFLLSPTYLDLRRAMGLETIG